MPVSSEVPTAYTSRWKVNSLLATGDPDDRITANGTSTPEPATRKYNTSCNACRRARVKCSRGNPCRRCAASAEPASCVYSISRRRGKRKASDNPQVQVGTKEVVSDQADAPDVAAVDPLLVQGWPKEPPPLLSPEGTANEDTSLSSSQQHTVDDIGNFPETFPLTGPATPIIPVFTSEGERCPDACYAAVHGICNKLISTLSQRGSVGLDQCMAVLDLASEYARKYLACGLCDTGCTRLMTLAPLHQRQLNLLCDICSNPSLYLSDDMRVSLGSYRPPNRELDVAVKRVMLLGVAKAVRERVEEIRERVEGFEDRIARGLLELAEAGRLNLQWLLGVTGNLTRRLDTIKAVLEKEDWGLNAEAMPTR